MLHLRPEGEEVVAAISHLSTLPVLGCSGDWSRPQYDRGSPEALSKLTVSSPAQNLHSTVGCNLIPDLLFASIPPAVPYARFSREQPYHCLLYLHQENSHPDGYEALRAPLHHSDPFTLIKGLE